MRFLCYKVLRCLVWHLVRILRWYVVSSRADASSAPYMPCTDRRQGSWSRMGQVIFDQSLKTLYRLEIDRTSSKTFQHSNGFLDFRIYGWFYCSILWVIPSSVQAYLWPNHAKPSRFFIWCRYSYSFWSVRLAPGFRDFAPAWGVAGHGNWIAVRDLINPWHGYTKFV